jgi:serine/threonine protein kinase
MDHVWNTRLQTLNIIKEPDIGCSWKPDPRLPKNKGAYATTYKTHIPTMLGTQVPTAVKMMDYNTSNSRLSDWYKRRMDAELEAVKATQNIMLKREIPYYPVVYKMDYCVEKEKIYIVMERFDATFHRWLRKSSTTAQQQAACVLQVLLAITGLGVANFEHNDCHSNNVMIKRVPVSDNDRSVLVTLPATGENVSVSNHGIMAALIDYGLAGTPDERSSIAKHLSFTESVYTTDAKYLCVTLLKFDSKYLHGSVKRFISDLGGILADVSNNMVWQTAKPVIYKWNTELQLLST